MTLAVVLATLGFLLVVAEVFFPSGGFLGFFSLASLAAAVYYAHQSGGAARSLPFAGVVVVLLPLVIWGAFTWLPHTRLGRHLLGEPTRPEDVAVNDPRRVLLGKVGVARSKMLPSGAVEIDGRMIDCITRGQAIDPGQYVKVVEVRGNRVVVRPAGEGERPGHEDPADMLDRPIEDLGLDSLDDPLV
ncbi:hypothetical protein Pla175_48180 [Pirellulimonas nuda]|uniref:NfeD-like C-terminal domain-containing protein n=2 Tax=Pirellulimonas nuda TaxID=2528009 RepID=A0A518DIW6_9BACT|nr:hypothetical protein Pla175_48180 [Pirellulimonas nuda]